MGMYGYIQVYMGMYGYIWVYMGMYGYICVYIWVYMDMYGYIWDQCTQGYEERPWDYIDVISLDVI